MTECYCDFDPPSVYSVTKPAARKAHKCGECGGPINPGQRYERVWGIWDGRQDTFRTCALCVDLREFVTAHVPCVCWSHGSMLDDAREAINQYAHECPGLFMGYGRRRVAINHAKGWGK